jgi:hypothetical protein
MDVKIEDKTKPMKKLIFAFVLAVSGVGHAQSDGSYAKLASEVRSFSADTTAVPEDELTHAIRELRKNRGGLDAQAAVMMKIGEEAEKGTLKKEEAEKLRASFATGKAAKWLENAVIRIYREHFTLAEIKDIAAFYATDAGKKMSESFPLVVLESMKAAETVMASYAKTK